MVLLKIACSAVLNLLGAIRWGVMRYSNFGVIKRWDQRRIKEGKHNLKNDARIQSV